MLKNKYLSVMLAFISLPVLGMDSTTLYLNNVGSQLQHVNTQIKTLNKEWNKSKAIIKKFSLLTNPNVFTPTQTLIDRIIASEKFINKMNTAVDQQYESIANSAMSFSAVKAENNISDFSPKTAAPFVAQLYKAMANQSYYKALGTKLVQKSKELAATIIGLQKQPISNTG